VSTWDKSGCPDIDEFFGWLAGDVSADDSARLDAHIEGCATCSARLRDVQAIARAAAREQEPAAPKFDAEARWADFRERLRVHQRGEILYPTSLPIKHWGPIAGALLLLIAVASWGFLVSRDAPVDAGELLARAAREEATAPATTHPVPLPQVRVRLEPPTGLARGRDAFAPIAFSRNPGADAALARPDLQGDAATLLTVAEQIGFDLQRPLSVAGLRAWRARASGLRDTVTFDGKSTWLLRTVVRDGPIRIVEVTARWDTYHVLRITLIAEGLGRVEAEELPTPTPTPTP
jgi:hypothetical protein